MFITMFCGRKKTWYDSIIEELISSKTYLKIKSLAHIKQWDSPL
jgi:hypothetical protein